MSPGDAAANEMDFINGWRSSVRASETDGSATAVIRARGRISCAFSKMSGSGPSRCTLHVTLLTATTSSELSPSPSARITRATNDIRLPTMSFMLPSSL